MPAVAVVILFGIAGAGLVVAGTYLLLGLGAALVLSGVLMFAAAAFVRSGMMVND